MNYLLSDKQKDIRRRIIEICYQRKFTHIGSCLGAVDIIDEVYAFKKKDDKFILSNGHAGVALYAVLEKHRLILPTETLKLNIHPDRNLKLGIDVSTGSLGQGLPIALGYCLADRTRQVYCLISDGECMEGSVYESLRIARTSKLTNLTVIVNANGWGGYGSISTSDLIKSLDGFGYDTKVINGHDLLKIRQALASKTKDLPNLIVAETKVNQLPFLHDLDAHYYLMTEHDYQLALKLLS